MNEQNSRLCGVRAIYLTQLFLADETRNLQNILVSFPNVKREGISLNDVTLYLRQKGYCVIPRKMSDKDIFDNDGHAVYIVLVENSNGSHVVVKRKVDAGTLQTIDFPKKKEEKLSSIQTKKSYLGLRVTRGDCGGFNNEIFLFLAVGLIVCVFWATKFKRRFHG
jgi:hypothetical protein